MLKLRGSTYWNNSVALAKIHHVSMALFAPLWLDLSQPVSLVWAGGGAGVASKVC